MTVILSEAKNLGEAIASGRTVILSEAKNLRILKWPPTSGNTPSAERLVMTRFKVSAALCLLATTTLARAASPSQQDPAQTVQMPGPTSPSDNPLQLQKPCPVCLDKLGSPVLSCRHHVCLECALDTRLRACPICRKPFSKVPLTTNWRHWRAARAHIVVLTAGTSMAVWDAPLLIEADWWSNAHVVHTVLPQIFKCLVDPGTTTEQKRLALKLLVALARQPDPYQAIKAYSGSLDFDEACQLLESLESFADRVGVEFHQADEDHLASIIERVATTAKSTIRTRLAEGTPVPRASQLIEILRHRQASS